MARRKKYPLQSSKAQLNRALTKAKSKIQRSLTPSQRAKLNAIKRKFKEGKVSLKRNITCKRIREPLSQVPLTFKTVCKVKGKRKNYHDAILRKKFKDKRTIDKRDPDVYFTAGLPASGKTSAMLGYIPEETLLVDSDSFKSELAERTRSPHRKFRLMHAPLLHEESDILVSRTIRKGIKEKRDMTIDMTFGNFAKGRRMVKKFKNAGYDVHLLGTQKPPHHSVFHVASRFTERGRFVPPEVVYKKGNRINRNVMKARKLADSHIIKDTTDWKNKKIISQSKRDLRYNFRNPKRKRN